jgi:hypothetical protein
VNERRNSTVRRMCVVLAVAIMATSCDRGNPNAPTEGVALADGDYVLTISLGLLPRIGGSPVFCMIAQGPTTATAGFPVRVTGAGQTWTVRMAQPSGPGGGSLEMTLTANASSKTGTISGAARTADDSVALTIPVQTSLTVTERSANNFDGQIEGDARLESGQGTLTCRSSIWAIAPR